MRYRQETFVVGMPEMVEVVKNQDKRAISAVGSVLFGYAGSATGVTSLTPLHALVLNFVLPFVNVIPLTQMEFSIYTHVIDSSTEFFKRQSAHDDRESAQVCR